MRVTPFGWAAAGAAVAGVAGAAIQSSAISDAQDSANAEQRMARDQARIDLAPYMQAGTNALAPSQDLLGLNGQDAANAAMANFQSSPGYQYQFNQGMRAVQSSAAAQGMLNSGATLKALQDRGNQLGAVDFGTYYNRLLGIASLGQNAAAGVGNNGIATARDIAQTDASAASGQASIYGSAAKGIGNQLNTRANYDAYNNSMYGQQNALMSGYGNPQQSAINSGNYAYGAGGYTGQGPYLGG